MAGLLLAPCSTPLFLLDPFKRPLKVFRVLAIEIATVETLSSKRRIQGTFNSVEQWFR
jgi:hypothetical protein